MLHTDLSRRSLLVVGGSAVGALAVAGGPAVAREAAPAASRRLRDPFTLGVASGDPEPDGVVIWTRLAPDPLAEDGSGGMPARDVQVRWEVAEDARFRRVVKRGRTSARRALGHSVHVEVAGLRAGRAYHYRFQAEGHVSPAGRTQTAPARGTTPSSLTMAFASCAQYEHGFFTSYRRMAQDEPDLVLHLGDYQYEYKAGGYVAPEGTNVRDIAGPETTTLAGYRQRHAQYKNDPDLQAAHAVAPWLVVWDDHELDNNWADEVPEKAEDGFLERRRAAFQAYYENMPLRRSSMPQGIDMQLYRRIQWGQLASFHMLDTRQYRSDQACGDGNRVDCAPRLDPARTLTGEEQERWLLDGLRSSRARWDVLGQQVFFAEKDSLAGPQKSLSMDAWDGYVASRQRVGEGLRAARNAVVLTGDVHRHYAADLKADYADPSSETIGTELVCTSISTGGDGSDRSAATDVQLAENPHIKFASTQRGYVRTRFTADRMRADFRVLPYVRQPGAPVSTRASFVVHDGRPGLDQVSPV